uniref:Uncharacterized protein n=1 Tax=Anopheles quadriannulatus TaxID=34691 RepID=A0A182XRX8_ANOQN
MMEPFLVFVFYFCSVTMLVIVLLILWFTCLIFSCFVLFRFLLRNYFHFRLSVLHLHFTMVNLSEALC